MRIKEQRRKLKISQYKLAKLLNINQTAISQWEKGETMPRADKLPILAKILKCTIEELYSEEELECKVK